MPWEVHKKDEGNPSLLVWVPSPATSRKKHLHLPKALQPGLPGRAGGMLCLLRSQGML